MTTAYKQTSKAYYNIIRGLAFEETIKVQTQDCYGHLSPLDLTNKTVSLNLKTSQDSSISVLFASTTNGKIIVGNGFITLRLCNRLDSQILPIGDLVGVLYIADSATRDIPLLFLTFKIQLGL